MRIEQEELRILQGMFVERYVSLVVHGKDTTDQSAIRYGFVQEITPNFILITETEGEIISPAAISIDKLASIECLPEDVVADIHFQLAEQASSSTSKGAHNNDTKFN